MSKSIQKALSEHKIVKPICDGDSLKDNWYLIELHQFNKQNNDDPDYFTDFVELINGSWDLGGYEKRCKFSKVIGLEVDND